MIFQDITFIYICCTIVFLSISIYCSSNIILDLVLMSVISMVYTLFYVFVSAGDVAITEACINVFLSTSFFIITVFYTKNYNSANSNNNYIGIFLIFFISVFSVLYIYDAPILGAYSNVTNNEVYSYYLDNTKEYFHFPNVVAAILAGFRGFDTLFETVVIFISALSVYIIIKGNYDER